MKLNELIEAVRTKLALSQEAFAALVHVRARTVYNWEEGAFEPHPSALQRVAAIAPTEFRELLVAHLPEHMREWSRPLEVPKFWWEVAAKEGEKSNEAPESWLFGALSIGMFVSLGRNRAAIKQLARTKNMDEMRLSSEIVEAGLKSLGHSPSSTAAEQIREHAKKGEKVHARRRTSERKREAG